MPIALERGEGIGGGPGYSGTIPCFTTCDPPPAMEAVEASASRSSSIGRNSDCSLEGGADGEGGEAEVQSSYKGPLDTMDDLEESLPIRRGISKFYRGKSKSFAILSDAMTKLSSLKELGKPENAYSRKRKMFLALTSRWDTTDFVDRTGEFFGSASKRHAHSSSMILSSFSASSSGGEKRDSFELHPPPIPSLRHNAFPVRSFSLVDLEGMESLSSSSSLSSIGSEEHKGFS